MPSRSELARAELLQALQRAAILSNEKFRGVRLVLGNGQLKIICTNSEQEEAEEELEVGYQGEPLDIGFNITYLLDVLAEPRHRHRSCSRSATPTPARWSRCRSETITNTS